MKPLPVINRQPASKYAGDGGPDPLSVVAVFDTLQGEGPYAGSPATFIRMAGCNLTCPTCDTNYTDGEYRTTVEALASACTQNLVVITGGEPFRQNLDGLLRALVARGRVVQIETNGTMPVPAPTRQFLTQTAGRTVVGCSPKTAVIHKDVIPCISFYKYILRAGEVDPADGLPTASLGMPSRPYRPANQTSGIFVQPVDEGDPVANNRNAQAAVESCMRFGYRLSLQLHKQLNLP